MDLINEPDIPDNGIAQEPRNRPHACACIGPQNGQPRCPCMMQGVSIRNGRYIQEIDLGPAYSVEEQVKIDEAIRRLTAQLTEEKKQALRNGDFSGYPEDEK